MTLSTEIAALTGNEDAATLRAIDARVADLIGWWPAEYTRHCVHGSDRRYKATRGNMLSTEYLDCPNFTTSLDATLAEIRRRGWRINMRDTWDEAKAIITATDSETLDFRLMATCERTDDNLALAALEALVRAVDGQGK